MKKQSTSNKSVVQGQRTEKIWIVQYAQVRRHSRVLYLPLDPMTVRLNKVKKGDIIKFELLELMRAPEEDTPMMDKGELE